MASMITAHGLCDKHQRPAFRFWFRVGTVSAPTPTCTHTRTHTLTLPQFNNAGIMHSADDNAINTEERIWDLTQAINVKGVWFGCKYAIIAMRKVSTSGIRYEHTEKTWLS